MKKRIYIISFFILFISQSLFSQVTQNLISEYKGEEVGQDLARDIAADSSGNIYVTGFISGKGKSADFTTTNIHNNKIRLIKCLFNIIQT